MSQAKMPKVANANQAEAPDRPADNVSFWFSDNISDWITSKKMQSKRDRRDAYSASKETRAR